ncbi:hypothetical protein C2S51_003982 [Perilla frutescens var. frutescens]|nr:hypothetical protein C2S51_003982 [Perilla frutescens var. frutescens]
MYTDHGPKLYLYLKVVINKQKTNVLFAEANSDFIDVLLSFLTLPLGRLVTKLPTAVGSLNTLYSGLSNLDNSHFCVGGAKQMLVSPKSSFEDECRRLKLDITDSQPTRSYFLCQDRNCPYSGSTDISLYSDIAICSCGKPLNREMRVAAGNVSDGDGVFTINPLSFLVTDDLRIAPIVTGFLQTLNNLGITDTEGAELQSLSFGMLEIKELLKLSIFSATPLTDLVIKKTQMSSTAVKPEPGILLHHIEKDAANSRPGKMVLKVCLQKSTNKFLFAEATNEFVEFLFSFVTVPLGGVEFLLGGSTGLKNIDNLYKSVTDSIDNKYFMTPEMKNRLLNPKLAHGYISSNQFLPLTPDTPPKLYHGLQWNESRKLLETCFHHEKGVSLVDSFKSSEGRGYYVKKQTICFVTDDLTVTPSLATSISILNGKGIPLSDLKEIELQIGLEEALSILKASLTSKTPLSDVLIKPMLNKLPKLEHQPKQER